MIVDFQGSSVMTTDNEGNTTGSAETAYTVEAPSGTYGAEGGSQLEQTAEAPQTTVEIPMTEGESATAEGTEAGASSVTGDLPTSEKDGTYDYTTEEIVEQGSVTITTKEITTEALEEDEQEQGYENNLDYVHTEAKPSNSEPGMENGNDLFVELDSAAQIPENPEDLPEVQEGYNYILLGSENTSEYFPARLFTSPVDENEKPIYNIGGVDYYIGRNGLANIAEGYHEGNKNAAAGYVIDDMFINGEKVSPSDIYVYTTGDNGEAVKVPMVTTEIVDGQEVVTQNFNRIRPLTVWGAVQHFVMMDSQTQQLITTYCADQTTYALNGYSYNMENLEDADYYTAEQAAQIRTIAENGYWGTNEGIGSLDNMRTMMRNAQDENGKPLFTEEEIASLTDGIAMTATQFAIWRFSNDQNVQVGINYINNSQGAGKEDLLEKSALSLGNMKDLPQEKDYVDDLIYKLSHYLATMEKTEIEAPTTANTVITAENAVKDLSVTVIEKAENHVNNTDDDATNDAYVTALSFALVVTPSTENGDDMIVKIISNGQVVKEARIAGHAKEGETLENLTCDENGNYTVSGITLTEGDQQFNITLEGIQNLETGVYLYTSEVRNVEDEDGNISEESSQTMVGLAGGERAVNVSMTINFELNVDDEVVATERVWRNEWTNPEPPSDDPVPYLLSYEPDYEEEEETFHAPEKEEEEENENTKIEDEEVPLAAAPRTGDISLVWAALTAVSLGGITMLSTKRKEED